MVVLGQKYRDKITRFEGVVTARFEYLSGCIRYALEAEIGEDQKHHERVFDEDRLVHIGTGAPAEPEPSSGGPQGATEDLAIR